MVNRSKSFLRPQGWDFDRNFLRSKHRQIETSGHFRSNDTSIEPLFLFRLVFLLADRQALGLERFQRRLNGFDRICWDLRFKPFSLPKSTIERNVRYKRDVRTILILSLCLYIDENRSYVCDVCLFANEETNAGRFQIRCQKPLRRFKIRTRLLFQPKTAENAENAENAEKEMLTILSL